MTIVLNFDKNQIIISTHYLDSGYFFVGNHIFSQSQDNSKNKIFVNICKIIDKEIYKKYNVYIK